MDFYGGLALCLSIQALAMVVPGQNHFMLLSISSAGRIALAMTVLGIASAGVVFSTGVVLGIWLGGQATSAFWFAILNVFGAVYLIYLGIRLILPSWNYLWLPSDDKAKTSFLDKALNKKAIPLKIAFKSGFLVNISNSKSGLFFASIFSTTLPLSEMNIFYVILAVIAFFLNSILFHGIIAGFFTLPNIQTIILKWNNYIQMMAGSIFVVFGLTIVSIAITNMV